MEDAQAPTRMRPHPTIIGLGEILWDIFPEGKRLGGAPANFAYHANALGARGVVVSRIGTDALGAEILNALGRLGMDTQFISTDPDHATGTVAVRVRPDGQPEFTITENVAWDHLPFSPALATLVAEADAVCFGTLGLRSSVSRSTVRKLLDLARPSCRRVFDVNIRQHYWDRQLIADLLQVAEVLKLNQDELALFQREFGLPVEETAALDALRDRFNLRLIALTRGDQGSVLMDERGLSSHAGVPVKVVDAVGAGDAFTAALILGWLEGRGLDELNRRANLMASFVCSRPGATPELTAELKAQLAAGAP